MPSYSPMKPNPQSSAGQAKRSRAQRYETPPSATARALRPVGYLLIGLVWTIIGAVTLSLPALLTVGLASNDSFTTKDFVQNGDIFVLILAGLFAVVVLVPLLGYAFIALPLASVPLAVLAFTYLVRSLRPSYASERLSATGWTREAIGPITVYPTAMSLLPLRVTPWTRFWTQLMFLGWIPGKDLLLAAIPYGLVSFLVPGWLLWPVSPAAAVVWSIVSLALVVATVVLVVRAARVRFNGARRGVPVAAGS
ncbi:hypothetical protein [Leifsonia poae]|nr:hypothetical protein [Leifsonia poae]